jgi:hypothetical protein
MKTQRKKLMIISILIMFLILGFIYAQTRSYTVSSIIWAIYILIAVFATIVFIIALKKEKEEREGFQTEDELSNLIKYKAGYKTYKTSMYMWLYIFLLKDKFPNTEIMLGGGIMLSALISLIYKFLIKREFNEK